MGGCPSCPARRDDVNDDEILDRVDRTRRRGDRSSPDEQALLKCKCSAPCSRAPCSPRADADCSTDVGADDPDAEDELPPDIAEAVETRLGIFQEGDVVNLDGQLIEGSAASSAHAWKSSPEDGIGQVHEALTEALMRPLLSQPTGWPLSQMFRHHMEFKHAFVNAGDASRRTVLAYLLGTTRRPSTHRRCLVQAHERALDIAVEALALTEEQLGGMKGSWEHTVPQEVASRGYGLGPGSSWGHLLVGTAVHPESRDTVNDVRLHAVGPSNPGVVPGLSGFCQRFLEAHHRLFFLGGLREQTGPEQLAALAKLFPRSGKVLASLLTDVHYEVVAARIFGTRAVLRHSLKGRWDLEAIKKHYGSEHEEICRNRPMYSLQVRLPGPDTAVVLTVSEKPGHTIEMSFLTSGAGRLVCADARGRHAPTLPEVPSFAEGSFRIHIKDVKQHLGIFGCGGVVDLPSMEFSLEATPEPHTTFTLRCLAVGKFPMERFYSMLFDARLMRGLLVRHFEAQLSLVGDAGHLHLSFRTPILSRVLKGALRFCSKLFLGVIFGSAKADPLPLLLEGIGCDFAALEADLENPGS
mmetsp:Transcript_35057/g.98432  ORF Transcript_35057/g.98432 Transcript_35057/m.98432 type:complete len:581 (-) Transcript_35057:121-1863(-)